MIPARSITLMLIAPTASGQLSGRSVGTQKFSCPPGVVSVSDFRVCLPVVIDDSLKVFWRAIRKRVISQQCYHYRRTIQKPGLKLDQPEVSFIIAESGETHFPVQSRLVRSNKSLFFLHITRLPFEFIREPIFSIVTSPNNNFRS